MQQRTKETQAPPCGICIPTGGFAVVGFTSNTVQRCAHVHSQPSDVFCALGLEDSSFSLLILFHVLSR